MKRFLALAALALIPSASPSAPPKAPATVKVRVGQIVSVEVEGDGEKEIAFAAGFAPESCYLDEGKPYRKGTARLILSPYEAKVHRVILWTVGERESVTLVVDATGGDPVTPPNPPPKPPNPPAPDPLTKSLSDAFDATNEPDKRERVRAFAAVMREAAVYASEQTVGTNEALAKKVSARTNEKVGGSLLAVRRAVGAHLGAQFPEGVFTLTPETRKQFASAYTKIAAALDTLAP